MITDLTHNDLYSKTKEARHKFDSFLRKRFSIDLEAFATSKTRFKQIRKEDKLLLVDFMELYQVTELNKRSFDQDAVEAATDLKSKLQMLYVYFSEYRNVVRYNVDKLTSFYDYLEYLDYITSLPSQEVERQGDSVEIIRAKGAELQRKLSLFANLVNFLESKEKNAILLERNEGETIDELYSASLEDADDLYTVIKERREIIRRNLWRDRKCRRDVQQGCG